MNTAQPVSLPFRVHIGYSPKGRNRWRRFPSIVAATSFCSRVFAASGVVLSITAAP